MRDQFQGGVDNDLQDDFGVLFLLQVPGKIAELASQSGAGRPGLFNRFASAGGLRCHGLSLTGLRKIFGDT
ncbi:hypothetical protein D9M72_557620 [compost metagenome]